MELLDLEPGGEITGTRRVKTGSELRDVGGHQRVMPVFTTENYSLGQFNPFNEGMIASALAKKYGLSEEEQANIFKSGMFQPLSRSIVQTLDPKKYINELRATRTQTPAGFLSQQAMMSPDMMGSGSARKAAMDARGALRRKRQEEIAKASGQLSGQKDSILAQITSWDEAARQAAKQAQVGQFGKGGSKSRVDKGFFEGASLHGLFGK
jgi:hypothetical protein